MEENMKTASKRDAVKEGMFYFRKDIESRMWTSIISMKENIISDIVIYNYLWKVNHILPDR